MRVVSANVFCFNPRPGRAMDAIARQEGDIVALIEATGRFEKHLPKLMAPRRAEELPRPSGMPIALHAHDEIPVEGVRAPGRGWVEANVGGVSLFVAHVIAPYLLWRLPKRERQLRALAARMNKAARERPQAPALVVGDFNAAHWEPTFRRFERRVKSWRRVGMDGSKRQRVVMPGERWHGTWPMGAVWSPVALDHAVAMTSVHGEGEDEPTVVVRPFDIPGSDHRGLVIDLPKEVIEAYGAQSAA